MSAKGHAIGMVIPGGFRLQESRPARGQLFSKTWNSGETGHGWGGFMESSLEIVKSGPKMCTSIVGDNQSFRKDEASVRCVVYSRK